MTFWEQNSIQRTHSDNHTSSSSLCRSVLSKPGYSCVYRSASPSLLTVNCDHQISTLLLFQYLNDRIGIESSNVIQCRPTLVLATLKMNFQPNTRFAGAFASNDRKAGARSSLLAAQSSSLAQELSSALSSECFSSSSMQKVTNMKSDMITPAQSPKIRAPSLSTSKKT